MSGKRAKALRRKLKVEAMHVVKAASGEEVVLKEYSHGDTDVRSMHAEGGSFEDAVMLTFMGPCPSIGMYWDKNPACGNPNCRISIGKYPNRPAFIGDPGFRIGIAAGERPLFDTKGITRERHNKNPGASYFEHPCDICRVAYQARGTEFLVKLKAAADAEAKAGSVRGLH